MISVEEAAERVADQVLWMAPEYRRSLLYLEFSGTTLRPFWSACARVAEMANGTAGDADELIDGIAAAARNVPPDECAALVRLLFAADSPIPASMGKWADAMAALMAAAGAEQRPTHE